MAKFALFNYQFDKVALRDRQLELEGMETVVMSADESFPQRQEIFGRLLQKDYDKTETMRFVGKSGQKEYIHVHLMKPTAGIVAMRIANKKSKKIADSELKNRLVDDYQNCVVIIDNSQGVQRLLVESKKNVFDDVKQLATILEYTFNIYLQKYSLQVRLEHLLDQRVFWQYANDTTAYPNGFHKLRIHLPYPNLDRLKKVYDRIFSRARQSFDSQMDIDFVATEGRKIRLDMNDEKQFVMMKWLLEEAGAEVKLYSCDAKRTPIAVGESSYRIVMISDSILELLTKNPELADLFGRKLLDQLKSITKTGLDE